MESKKGKNITSMNDKKCITKCYDKFEIYTHPITFQKITNRNIPTCGINPFFNGEKQIIYDMCVPDKKNKDKIDSFDISMHIDTNLLLSIYNINNWSEGFNYIKQNRNILHIDTQIRIINILFLAYGETVDIIDDNIVDCILFVINNKWINAINREIKKKIEIDFNLVNIFLNNYFNKYKKKWNTIQIHSKLLKKELINYIKK